MSLHRDGTVRAHKQHIKYQTTKGTLHVCEPYELPVLKFFTHVWPQSMSFSDQSKISQDSIFKSGTSLY
jgi:hypothetical protein